MLSGETAIGKYPVESVRMMSRIAGEAETLLCSQGDPAASGGWPLVRVEGSPTLRGTQPGGVEVARTARVRPVTESVVEGASLISQRLNAPVLVVDTHSGRTALALSKQRNRAVTLAMAHDLPTARAMALYWGVTPVLLPENSERAAVRAFLMDRCKTHGLAAPGDLIVSIRGSVPDDPTHNEIEVYAVS
jgi:pyruvate kinase